jgi:AraC-like DNA-binding protein
MFSSIKEWLAVYRAQHACAGMSADELRNHILIIGKLCKSVAEIIRILEKENYHISHSKHINNNTEKDLRVAQVVIIDCEEGFDLLENPIICHVCKKNTLAIIKSVLADKRHAYRIGVLDYITSPIIPEELLFRVKTCLLFYQHQSDPFIYNKFISLTDVSLQDNPATKNNTDLETRNNIEKPFNENAHLVEKTCCYLLENISQQQSLYELARIMGTNRNKLSFCFKKTLGVSVFSWLREARMKKSIVLLKSTSLSIQSICLEVGYNDAANFSTAFKNFFGIPPKEYRKK